MTGSEDVAIAIGLEYCSRFPEGCASVPITEIMGDILYSGPYDPEYHEDYKPQYQNFSILVPETFPTGLASLSVAHFVLVGVSVNGTCDDW